MSGSNNSSSSYRSDVGIGALVGGGLFATALGCGVIALGPLAIPIGIGAVLAGAILFPTTIKPAITKVVSDANIPKTYIQRNFGGVALSENSWKNLMQKIPLIGKNY
jgi:hypothetical protein